MTSKSLLKQAIKSFKDNYNTAILYKYKTATTDQGFSYVTKLSKTKKSIECAIHYDTSLEFSEDKGTIRNVEISLITRESLTTDCLIEYEDLTIFINSYRGFNEKMGQYEYSCKALTKDKIKLLDKLKETYGYSIYDKLLNIEEFSIIPKYTSQNVKFDGKVALYEKSSSQPMSLIDYRSSKLSQTIKETSEFILVNFTRLDVMKFIKNIENLSLIEGQYGLASNYDIEEMSDIDVYSVLKGITYKVTVDFCYNIEMKTIDNDKYIKQVVLIYDKGDINAIS